MTKNHPTNQTVLDVSELKDALIQANKGSNGLNIKEKSKIFHSILDAIAKNKGYNLKLRR